MSSVSTSEDQALVLASPDHQTSQLSSIQAGLNSETEGVPAPRLFTYDSGHGDFCFLRLVNSYPKPPIGIVDNFVRSGQFRLMELPREIRDEIYKLVLAPVLAKHGRPIGQRQHIFGPKYGCLEYIAVLISHMAVLNIY